MFRVRDRETGKLQNEGYATLLGACEAWEKNPTKLEVVRVGGADEVLEPYDSKQCNDALRKVRST
jgi:hypothetical protein